MDWTPALDWLEQRGFTREASDADRFIRVSGSIPTGFGSVRARLYLDVKGIDFPHVELMSKPGWLPDRCAHLNESLFLCCNDKATSAPDRRFPREIAEQTVVRASKLLEDLVNSGGNAADEFVKLWGGESSVTWGYLKPKSDGPEIEWHLVTTKSAGSWTCVVPSDRLDEAKKWLGETSDKSCLTPLHIDVSEELVAKGPGWPIRCLNDLRLWLEYVDPKAREALVSGLDGIALQVALHGIRSDRLFVLLHHQSANLGILFDLWPLIQWLPRAARRNSRIGAAQFLSGILRDHLGNPTRCRFVDCDPMIQVERALGQGNVSLAGKRILLVGAGSVGSHVAMGLVRSGAGVGGGTLRVYDPDTVALENIARSVYRTEDLDQNKAVALCSSMKQVFPGTVLEPSSTAAPTEANDYQEFDLIVDASGDHAFSAWLSYERRNSRVPPLLICYVSGRGAAVVSYAQVDAGASCFSCLRPADPGSQWNPLTQQEEAGSHQIGPCGESYMPYAVGAPMMAAGLLVTHILDVVRGVDERPARCIVLAPGRARDFPAQAPSSCPCGLPQ